MAHSPQETQLLGSIGSSKANAILDSYPNALSIKEVEADYVYVPWVNMVVLILMLVVFIWAGVKIRKLFRSAKDKITNRPATS